MLMNTEKCVVERVKKDRGADFSKGAMETLAMATDSNSTETEEWIIPVTVVATYTDKPDLPTLSTGVCRAPVALPPIDIERVMDLTKVKDEKENYYFPFHFAFDKKKLDREGKRLFATLKFKLALKIAELRRDSIYFPIVILFTLL